ncbi:sensor domain-containing protein [Nocardioides sp. SYSU DS0663]|uniref:sensor domain-containing protein n=1 Tax=Nocardioides sp. SYSU DS0663 TaxID=3416445 RepID=UPI003F4BB5B2
MTGPQRDLRTTEHRARFEQSALPQATADTHARLTEVNDAFCRLLGVPREELVGRQIADLTHASDPGAAHPALADLLAQRTETVQVEPVLRGRGGRPVPVLVDANLLRDEDGEVVGAAAFVQDLSRFKDLERRRQQQEDFFLALAQRATDVAIVVDGEGRLLFISPSVNAMLGYSAHDELMRSGWDFVHPDDVERLAETFEGVVRDGGTRTATVRVLAADGSWRHVEETITNLLDSPVGGLVCNLRDITDQVQAQQALAASEARYRAIVENADEGIWVAARDGRTTFVNSRMLEITGLTAEQAYSISPADLFDGPTLEMVMDRLTNRGLTGPERYEFEYPHPDGQVRHFSVSATPLRDDTGFEGSLALVSDVTASHSAARELAHAASHDTLTGLPNRAELQHGVRRALERSPDSTAVVFIDLDHFKVVNDARGHSAGDDVLREVAARLQASVRPGDLVARFGGDEFVVVCERVTAEDVGGVAERLLGAVEEPVPGAGARLLASASVGIALSPSESSEQLLRQADAAMYAAKSAGRRTIRFFDESLASSAEDRYRLSHDLRAALTEGQLHHVYQPIVDLHTGAVLGAEALARWRHPAVGPVSPDRFVPVALESGIAAELDFWSVHNAARDLATLRALGAMAPDRYVAVNLSARTLDHPALLDELQRAVEKHGLAPRDLVLEVTEATLVTRSDVSIATLQALAHAGHQVALDDFGTGHSALAYLQDLPVGVLKIDRSFVRDLATSRAARAIARSVVGLAHGLGMRTVAEGVEEEAQVAVLRDLGCDAGQGWYWSAGIDLEAAQAGGHLTRDY